PPATALEFTLDGRVAQSPEPRALPVCHEPSEPVPDVSLVPAGGGGVDHIYRRLRLWHPMSPIDSLWPRCTWFPGEVVTTGRVGQNYKQRIPSGAYQGYGLDRRSAARSCCARRDRASE